MKKEILTLEDIKDFFDWWGEQLINEDVGPLVKKDIPLPDKEIISEENKEVNYFPY